jgi:hypothetical protein
MDVNHDLIAAGHPRLNFEYSAYLEAYPKHWEEKKPSTAEDWAIGQAVIARASFKLLADRAQSSVDQKENPPAAVAPWPELSELECFSCHHSLHRDLWIPDRGVLAVKRGRPPWATWTSTMLPELQKVNPAWKIDAADSPWVKLRGEMSSKEPNPREVAKSSKEPDPREVAKWARKSVELIDGWLNGPKGVALTGPEIVSLTKKLATGWPDRPESWDQLAQRTLAIEAMIRAGNALGVKPSEWEEIVEPLKAARKKLGFPTIPGRFRFDSPPGGRPGAEP